MCLRARYHNALGLDRLLECALNSLSLVLMNLFLILPNWIFVLLNAGEAPVAGDGTLTPSVTTMASWRTLATSVLRAPRASFGPWSFPGGITPETEITTPPASGKLPLTSSYLLRVITAASSACVVISRTSSLSRMASGAGASRQKQGVTCHPETT